MPTTRRRVLVTQELPPTGVPWRDQAERYGPWQSVYSRFWRWQRSGLWERALAALHAEADVRGELDWSLRFVDGAVVRAHQHAAGAKTWLRPHPGRGCISSLGRER